MFHAKRDGKIAKFNKLIKQMAAGSKEAFKDFYNCYSSFIYSTAIRTTSYKPLVEDIVDDVLVKVWNSAPKQKHISNPYGWLYAVIINCAKDYFKTDKTFAEIFDVAVVDKGVKELEDPASFHSMLACLTEDEERVVKLHLEENYTFGKIALLERKSLSTISSVYYRAIDKVKYFLNKKKLINFNYYIKYTSLNDDVKDFFDLIFA